MTRAHGEGSVSVHKATGLYVAQVSLGTDATGKRLRKTAYGRTEADDRAWAEAGRTDPFVFIY